MRRLNYMNLQQFNNIRVPDTRIKILGCKNESRKTLGAQVITRMPNFTNYARQQASRVW